MVGASLALALARHGSSTSCSSKASRRARRRSRASTSAPPRSATPAAASSRRLGVWASHRAARPRPSARSMSPMPAASASRGCRREEQGIDAFGFVVTEPRDRRGAVGEARRLRTASRCACRRTPRPSRSRDDGVRARRRRRSQPARTRPSARGSSSRRMARIRACAPPPASMRRSRTTIRSRWSRTSRPIGRTMAPHMSASRRRVRSPCCPCTMAAMAVDLDARRRSEPRDLLALSDAAFLDELQTRFGWRAGRFMQVGRRASYPLKLTRAATTVATRAVLIGNAAQALHPVAGQGFNLGLRDAAMLAELLAAQSQRRSPARRGAAGALREPGAPAIAAASSASPTVSSSCSAIARPGMGLARNLGLLLFDLTPPAKSALARVSAGFAGPTPRLARGLARALRAHDSSTGRLDVLDRRRRARWARAPPRCSRARRARDARAAARRGARAASGPRCPRADAPMDLRVVALFARQRAHSRMPRARGHAITARRACRV